MARFKIGRDVLGDASELPRRPHVSLLQPRHALEPIPPAVPRRTAVREALPFLVVGSIVERPVPGVSVLTAFGLVDGSAQSAYG